MDIDIVAKSPFLSSLLDNHQRVGLVIVITLHNVVRECTLLHVLGLMQDKLSSYLQSVEMLKKFGVIDSEISVEKFHFIRKQLMQSINFGGDISIFGKFT